MYGGQSTHLPLKINVRVIHPSLCRYHGFSSHYCPLMGGHIQGHTRNSRAAALPGTILYSLDDSDDYFFAYFYTAIIFNPPMSPTICVSMAASYLAFVGKKTAEYIDRTCRLTRCSLSLVYRYSANLSCRVFPRTIFFGGTGLLIVVGVAMDTMQQVESHLVMRHYESFIKKGRIKGRR
jgi:preprotein translocase subunit SecY